MTRFEAWTRLRVADGVLLAHPAGEQRGLVRIRYSGEVRTLRAVLADLVDESPRRLDGETTCAGVKRVITDEGEYAAIAVLRTTLRSGERLDRHVGVVVGDGVSVQFEGLCRRAGDREFAHEFEALVVRSSTGAAAERPRMFVYQPPPRWTGIRRALSTLWLAPTYPRVPATIEVHDAVPIHDDRAVWAHDLVRSHDDRGAAAITIGDLVGTRFDRGATLVDQRFRYDVDLDDPSGTHVAILDALVQSIEPVPTGATGSLDMLGFEA